MPAGGGVTGTSSALPGPRSCFAGIASRRRGSAQVSVGPSSSAEAAIISSTVIAAAIGTTTTVEAAIAAVKTPSPPPTAVAATTVLGKSDRRRANQGDRSDSGKKSVEKGGFPHVIPLHPTVVGCPERANPILSCLDSCSTSEVAQPGQKTDSRG